MMGVIKICLYRCYKLGLVLGIAMPKAPVRDNHAGSVIINGEKYPLPEQVIKNIETVINLQTDPGKKCSCLRAYSE